jgi:hypothetical protein
MCTNADTLAKQGARLCRWKQQKTSAFASYPDDRNREFSYGYAQNSQERHTNDKQRFYAAALFINFGWSDGRRLCDLSKPLLMAIL